MSQYRRLLSSHYHKLAQSLRSLGRAHEAIDAMRRRRASGPGDSTELYDVACELSLCVPIVRAEEKESLAAEAMGALRAAVNAGWSDACHTAQDKNLSPLRDRADFQTVSRRSFRPQLPERPIRATALIVRGQQPDQGIITIEPTVRRPSRSRCTCAASASG